MARLRFSLNTTAEVVVASTGTVVAMLFPPADERLALCGFGIGFDAVSSTAGAAQVQIVLVSSSGTYSAATLNKDRQGTTEALNTSGNFNCSAQPTINSVLRTYNIHPMTGYERAFANTEEIEIAGGQRVGLYVIASSSGPNAHGFLLAEE